MDREPGVALASETRGNGTSERQLMSLEAVLTAAAEAFTARGYSATSMDDVAARLQSTKGRVYHYFKTKGELFLGVHRRSITMAIERVKPVSEEDAPPSTRLFEMAKAHAELMMEESSFTRLSAQVHEMRLTTEGRTTEAGLHEILTMRREYEAIFERVIAEGMEQGEFRKGDPDLMTKAALGALNWMSTWYQVDGSKRHAGTSAHIANEMARFVVAGVTGEE